MSSLVQSAIRTVYLVAETKESGSFRCPGLLVVLPGIRMGPRSEVSIQKAPSTLVKGSSLVFSGSWTDALWREAWCHVLTLRPHRDRLRVMDRAQHSAPATWHHHASGALLDEMLYRWTGNDGNGPVPATNRGEKSTITLEAVIDIGMSVKNRSLPATDSPWNNTLHLHDVGPNNTLLSTSRRPQRPDSRQVGKDR